MKRFLGYITTPNSIAPLIVFRVLFGFIMLVSIGRFVAKGWIQDLYIEPAFFFTYYGFSWVQPVGEAGMYAVFALIGLASLCIMLGWQYRVATVVFFVAFTYVELIDKSNYLNHYYFVSIIAFLMMFVPANRGFSLDAWQKPKIEQLQVPAWTINIFKLQLGIVYFFAGVAKLNADWLFNAMPLKLWLPAHSHLPVIGPLLELPETAFLFSWAGALYDLTIVFFLLASSTRLWAYVVVLAFHMMTATLFQIGMFPYIMMLLTLIYFSSEKHQRAIDWAKGLLGSLGLYRSQNKRLPGASGYTLSPGFTQVCAVLLTLHFMIQLVLPFRYALYPGNVFWTEEGYRFSWRVMLMEKAGHAVFRVRDLKNNKQWEVANWDYLTPNQEKMMATQPDMIVQFAHFLEEEYEKQGVEQISISVDSYVTLNGARSRPFIDPHTDLTQVHQGLRHKAWVLPFEKQ